MSHEQNPIYAVGDIHGQSAELDRALDLIAADGGKDAEIVFLGDYGDRGPDTRGVLDRLIAGEAEGRPWTCILGNHDRMFLRFVRDGDQHDGGRVGLSWLNWRLGGDKTLGSYGLEPDVPPGFLWSAEDQSEVLSAYVSGNREYALEELVQAARDAVPPEHLEWIATRPLVHKARGLTFAHAGLRPGVPLDRQLEDDLVWIRDGWLDSPRGHEDHLVVHGHTVVDEPTDFGWRIATDAGAGYGDPLVPCVYEDGRWFTLSERGRAPMRRG